MAITGERTVPGLWHENYWFRRHEVVYASLADLVPGRCVLEAGCGEGYGAAFLQHREATVTALDYDAYAIGHVRAAYPDLTAVRGNLVALPFASASFDVVVSLQTIEHLWDQPSFVAECHRVLRPGGTLVVSTPNTLTFPPGNLYHPKELTAAELAALLHPHFDAVRMTGLSHGPTLTAWENEHGSIVDAQIAGPPETWDAALGTTVAAITTDDFAFAAHDLDRSLDLVAVAKKASR